MLSNWLKYMITRPDVHDCKFVIVGVDVAPVVVVDDVTNFSAASKKLSGHPVRTLN